MPIETELLRAWDGAWRSPKLWQALSGAEAFLSEQDAARAVTEVLARSVKPSEAFRALLRQEAFTAVDALLLTPSFVRSLNEEGVALASLDAEYGRLAVRVRARERVRRRFADRRPGVRSTASALAGRELPEWPYGDPIDLSCRMLLGRDTAYPGMAARWAPEDGDGTAVAFLEAFRATPRAQREADRAPIVALANALPPFLTGSAASPRVHAEAGHLLFEVPGLWSETLPALGRRSNREGLCFAIPLRGASPGRASALPAPYLYLDPEGLVRETPAGALRVRAGDLFGLLRDSTKRAGRFLSYLGRRIDPVDAIPGWWLAALPRGAEPAPEGYLTSALFEMLADLGVAGSAEAMDLLLFLSGGLGRVGWELIARALRSIGPREGAGESLTFEMVAESWCDRDFRDWLGALLRDSVPAGTPAAAVLQALVEDLTTSPRGEAWPRLTAEEIGSYLNLGADALDEAVALLARSGLVERRDGGVALVDGGPVWHLCEALGGD